MNLAIKRLRNLSELQFEVGVEKIKKKREDGKFTAIEIPYTPIQLIDELIDGIRARGVGLDITICVWYTVEMALRLAYKGFDNISIYLLEPDEEIKKYCNSLGFKYRVIKKGNGKMKKFVAFVGNPPYQSTVDGSKRKKPWVQIASQSIENADYVAFVTPCAWQHKRNKYFAAIGSRIKDKLVTYQDANEHFDVGENIGYWIIDNTLTTPLEIVIETNPFVKIYEKMLKNKGVTWHYRDFQNGELLSDTNDNEFTYPVYWTASQIKFARPADVKYFGPKVLINNSGKFFDKDNPEKYCRYDEKHSVGLGAWGIRVNNKTEGANVLSWVQSKLFIAIIDTIKSGGFNNPFIELRSLGKDKLWNDIEIYDHFDLSEFERETINNYIEETYAK